MFMSSSFSLNHALRFIDKRSQFTIKIQKSKIMYNLGKASEKTQREAIKQLKFNFIPIRYLP